MAVDAEVVQPVMGTVGAAPPRRYLRPLKVLAASVCFLLMGNLAVLAAHLLLRRTAPAPGVSLPITNFAQIDDRVWRGAAPSRDGYAALARHGVVTIVDLRAEDDIEVDEQHLTRLGITRTHIPLRDGQAPGSEQVRRFLHAVDTSPGRVFVHCGAGVGRTGTMAAAYSVSSGSLSPNQAIRRNLVVGPPSLEQLYFAAGLEGDGVRRPPLPVVALSRMLDAPRRTWVHLSALE